MASPKPLDLSAAELKLGGFNYQETADGRKEISFRHWTITLPDGDKFTLCYFRNRWRRWTRPHKDAYKADHWRNASASHAIQLTAWMRAHPDYIPDTHENRFIESRAS
ncbi:TPA: hypothetical protein QH074_004304 [Enterobacter hormaechei subsp. steigerwaltii]|nr:hypothetical protein [Enterobacter hormaechei subsp. steigerwaltii]